MNRIPNDTIPDCYKFSKQAFEGKITTNEAAVLIYNKHNIKLNSALAYPYYYKVLKSGQGSCRIINNYTQEYFLEHILKECGNQIECKKKILYNFKKLIEKFEGEQFGTKKTMRAIYEKWSKLV